MATRILFVCLGNICRSPLGEGILRHLAAQAGVAAQFEIDSAGTGDWHVGDPPDPRAIEVARRHGVLLDGLRARQVAPFDFAAFDHILAMDRKNLADLLELCPAEHAGRLRLLRQHDPEGGHDVPDPYFGGADGFDEVFAMLLRCCRRLLADLCESPPS